MVLGSPPIDMKETKEMAVGFLMQNQEFESCLIEMNVNYWKEGCKEVLAGAFQEMRKILPLSLNIL